MEPLRIPARARAAAWIVTGPVGHLGAGLADWLALVARWARARAMRREGPWWDA